MKSNVMCKIFFYFYILFILVVIHTLFNEELKALRDDYAYWLEIMKNGLCAQGYDDVLVDYRMRDDSMTASKTKMIKPQWNIYRKVLKLDVFSSTWYLFCWAMNGLKKYKLGKK